MSATAATETTARISWWDRIAVIILGGAGCLLSFDALRQMAVAIHIRPDLSWLFPVVLDGFIAYDVRAVLVLRNAPLTSRLYVWALFGMATTTSIWANAMHAVRLNDQIDPTAGLRLTDLVVAILSMVAPLALAGAVHLYILIARAASASTDGRHHHVDRAERADQGSGWPAVNLAPEAGSALTGHAAPSELVPADPDSQQLSAGQQVPLAETPTGHSGYGGTAPTDNAAAFGRQDKPGLPGQVSTDLADTAPDAEPPTAPDPAEDRHDYADEVNADRQAEVDTEELLEIARAAVQAEDKLTRKVVAEAIRGQQLPLSSATLTELMSELRKQHRVRVTPVRN